MSDTIEGYRALKQHRKQQKAENLASSTRLLQDRGVVYREYNNGLHLKINHGSDVIDFWPSTGLWAIRNRVPPVNRRGVFGLLRFIGK
jgi:hypothetical protein